jgi:zinc protease
MAASLAQGLSPVRAELSNGGVVLVQETVMTPAVTISASFRAGSMFDPVDLPGLAYLTGRAIDRGTERRSASMMADELDERGVSLRVSSNRQALTVSCTCLTEDFDDVLAIVADIVRNPAFPPLEIEKRRSEALTILRQNEDNPAARAVDAVLELLYGWHHPYGRPPKGTAIGV